MSQSLLISGALANVGGEVSIEEFLDLLSKKVPEAECYKVTGVSRAAFDWHVLLSDLSAVITFASALWFCYTKLIAPKKSDSKSDAGIYIVIGNPKDENSQFWIGNEYKDKEVFIHNFERRVKKVIETENDRGEIRREIIETEESSHWVKIK